MKTKLLLFEGIPGSGKSTFSRRASSFLTKNNIENCLFQEGCLHPSTLDGYAVIKADELDDLINKFPKFKDKIVSNITFVENHILIQIKKVFTLKNVVSKHLQPRSAWDGIHDFSVFKSIHLNSWAAYAEKKMQNDDTDIFDCAFMQDYITHMMLFYEKPMTVIIDFIKGLEEKIMPLFPFLFYLQQNNVRETITQITKKRIKEADGIPWGERVADLISTSPYGKTHNLSGFDGMVEFFKRRKEMDLAVISSLKMKHIFINNDDFDWKEVQGEVSTILKNLAD